MRHMWAALPDGQRFLTRIGPGIRGAGAGARDRAPILPPQFTPAGQAAARAGQGHAVERPHRDHELAVGGGEGGK